MINTAIILIVIFTNYNNLPEQTNIKPNETAFHREYGKEKHKCKVSMCGIAVSRDLEDQGFIHKCRVQLTGQTGTFKRLDGTDYCGGLYIINDRMHWRKRNQVDIFDFSYERAINFGIQKGTVQLLWCE